jgi:hypothetical protein
VRTDCVVIRARDKRLVGDRTVDVSWSGLQIAGVGEATAGEPVHLALRMPDSNLWVEAEGWVTRVVPGRRESDAGRAYGVRISRMDGMSRVLLGSVIRNYPAARPTRGEGRDYAREVARIAATL